MPASASSRCTASRLALKVLTRRSSGAGCSSASASAQNSVVGQLLAQRAGQPVRQVVAQLVGQRRYIDGAAALQPLALVRFERALQEAIGALPAQDGQAALQRATAALRKVLEQQPPAQHRIGRLGQRVALARAQVAVRAEEGRHHAVGGRIQLQHLADQVGAQVEQGS